ncbi:unnamed protein product [Trichobilharzia szidati]|nr:unnamed protein product [Trichobilharzia szidati]
MLRKAIDSMLILLRFDERKDYCSSTSQNWLWNPSDVHAVPPASANDAVHFTSKDNVDKSQFHEMIGNSVSKITTPLLNDFNDNLSGDKDYKEISMKTTRAKSIPLRNSGMNSTHNALKNDSNNRYSRRRLGRNQFMHVRLHSYDESVNKMQSSELTYCEENEFGTDVTYLALSEFTNSADQLNSFIKTVETPTTLTPITGTITVPPIATEVNRKDCSKSLYLPRLLPPPPSATQMKMTPQDHLKPPITTVLSPTSSARQHTYNNNNNNNNNFKSTPTELDNPRFSVNFNDTLYEELICGQLKQSSPPHYNYHQENNRDQHVKIQSYQDSDLILFPELNVIGRDDTPSHKTNLQGNSNCFNKLDQSEKLMYTTPMTGASDARNSMILNSGSQHDTTANINETMTIHDSLNNNHALFNNYSPYKLYSPNVHFNTSRSNSGQTLVDPDADKNYRRSRLHRSCKPTRQRRSNSSSNCQSLASISSSNSCFMNTYDSISKCQYQKHWSFTFYDFEDEHNTKEDDTALIHSIFAIVAARLRHKTNGSKGYIKKLSEYDKLDHSCHINTNANNSRSQTADKKIHQHLKLGSFGSNDAQKQSMNFNNNDDIVDKDEHQLWRLCIKWNPSDFSRKSAVASMNNHNNASDNRNDNIPTPGDIHTMTSNGAEGNKLKKTHILATLGTKIDKNTSWSDKSTLSLSSLDMKRTGHHNRRKRRTTRKHRATTTATTLLSRKNLFHQAMHKSNQSNLIACSLCQQQSFKSNHKAKKIVSNNTNAEQEEQRGGGEEEGGEGRDEDNEQVDKREFHFLSTDQTHCVNGNLNQKHSFDCKLKRHKQSRNSKCSYNQQHCLQHCPLKLNENSKFKRNSCHILSTSQFNYHNYNQSLCCRQFTPCCNYTTDELCLKTNCNNIQWNAHQAYSRENTQCDHLKCCTSTINDRFDPPTTTMLHCQCCLNTHKVECNGQKSIEMCNNTAGDFISDKLVATNTNANCFRNHTSTPMFCCHHCRQWFVPLWSQINCSRNRKRISKDDRIAYNLQNHQSYHRSSSQPQTKTERMIQNQSSDQIKPIKQTCEYHGHNISPDKTTCMHTSTGYNKQIPLANRQQQKRHIKKRAKSVLPMYSTFSDTNNGIRESPVKSTACPMASNSIHTEFNHNLLMNTNKTPLHPYIHEQCINFKQNNKFKRHNRKYLGQLNVQEWLGKTLIKKY